MKKDMALHRLAVAVIETACNDLVYINRYHTQTASCNYTELKRFFHESNLYWELTELNGSEIWEEIKDRVKAVHMDAAGNGRWQR